MRRHASADELASLAAGDLSPRKAARVSAHLEHCDRCRHVSRELEGVSTLLSSVSYEPMPDRVSVRVEAAIATEARHRVASEPATESARGELPARSRRTGQPAWRLPFVSSPMALRVAAVTGAAIVVVGGAYELANHGLGASSSSSASPPVSHRAALGTTPSVEAQMLQVGPQGHQHTVKTEHTGTDFQRAQLQSQVQAIVKTPGSSDQAQQFSGIYNTAPAASGVSSAANGVPSQSPSVAPTVLPGQSAADQQLSGCVDRVTSDQVPELVDVAKFEGQPATIIVVAAHGSVPAQVWVVGSSCSRSVSDILDHQAVKHL